MKKKMTARERAAWIYQKFYLRKLRAAALGRQLGVSKQMVAAVIRGEKRTPWIQEAIAQAIGMTWEGLWGQENRENQENQE